MRILGLAGLLVALLITFRISLKSFINDEGTYDHEEESSLIRHEKKRISKNHPIARRSPASAQGLRKFSKARGPELREKDLSQFQDFASDLKDEENNSIAESIPGSTSPSMESSNEELAENPRRKNPRERNTAESTPQADSDSAGPSLTIANSSPSVQPAPSPSSTVSSPSSGKSSGGTPTISPPNCSASVGGGTFNSPVNVSLNCSTASTINYCLAEGSCCDPSTGSTYALPLLIGATESTFCLSFQGTDSGGRSSGIIQQTYSFNSAAPNLQVDFQKTVYQTTQLEGFLSISSDDFGSSTLAGGVLNFKSSDPVVSGYTSCQDQVENSSPLSPVSVMAETSLSHLTSGQQLDVFFGNFELVYGDNFITSYLLNSAYGDVYSCSTSKVVLEDFPFFDSSPTFATSGSIHEFSGNFTATSFFEVPASAITRSPAGSSTEDQTGQELRSGLFGVFY